MLPKCCNYAWFVLQKWGTLAVHNRIMYCLAAYAVCVLQRFKKCAAQTFLFLFTNPQNYICCYCAVNIVWEDCICTAESSPLRYWYCICADATYKKIITAQFLNWFNMCVCSFSKKYICELKFFCRDNSMNYNYWKKTKTHYSSTQLILN